MYDRNNDTERKEMQEKRKNNRAIEVDKTSGKKIPIKLTSAK